MVLVLEAGHHFSEVVAGEEVFVFARFLEDVGEPFFDEREQGLIWTHHARLEIENL